VRVNGQPGRLLRGPGQERYGDAERLAAGKALALLRAGEVDANKLAAVVMRELADRGRTPRVVDREQAEVRVFDVLTVDVADGRIQTVRIVRNPDKLSHL
jgi:RNA polymerase sigma-70 factor (ECF subfamily)